MCEHNDYTEFPARIIGGPSGNYKLACDVTSCQWAEYMIVAIANGPGGPASVIVNGNSRQAARLLDYLGASTLTLNDDNAMKGNAFSLPASSSIVSPMIGWERITHSQKNIHARIDTVAGNSTYITVRFRIKEIKNVPGPAHTVHPDNMQQLNIARADATRQRLGLDKEIAQGETMSAVTERAKKQGVTDGQK